MVKSVCWGVKQTARFLACSEAHVYRLLRLRQLPGVKIGRDWRIDSRKLQAMFGGEEGKGEG